jgi:putative drug exporter of the RND superfamily
MVASRLNWDGSLGSKRIAGVAADDRTVGSRNANGASTAGGRNWEGAAVFGWLAQFGYRYRWPVIAVWAVLAIGGVAVGGQVFGRLTTVDSLRPDAESAVGERRAEALVPEGDTVFAIVRTDDLYDQALVASVFHVGADIKAMNGVLGVDDIYSNRAGDIGSDNRSTLIRVKLSKTLPAAEREALQDRVVAALHRIEAREVLVGGQVLAERAFADQAIRDAAIGESVALVAVLVLLVVILAGVLPASVPLLGALATVSATLLGLLLLSYATSVSEYAVNVVTLLGFGLVVDYALLLIYRYREERVASSPEEALRTSIATAGRAVLISGLAVVAALGGLAVFAEPLLAAIATGGAVVVVLATVCALTLVPALLGVAGNRIPPAGADTWATHAFTAIRARLLPRGRGFATGGRPSQASRPGLLERLAELAQRRPGVVVLAVSTFLIALAMPFIGANLGNSDARALPRSAEARQAYEALQSDFPRASASVVTVVAEQPAESAEMRDFLNQLNQLAGVKKLETRLDVPPEAAVIDLTTDGGSGGPQAQQVVRDARALSPAFEIAIAGPAAEVVDYQSSVASRLPAAFLVVLLATSVLLFALTRSLVVPVKAILMNVLTLLATLGILVMIFQWGLGETVLGFDSWGGLDLTTPVLLFVFVFALTMDYEVFLLARIKEAWDTHGDNNRAVLDGIRGSGRAVTTAAACITLVFLGFVLGDLVAVKEIGVGMAVAVVLDVTVVRGLLLPAVMTMLGRWNWWAPRPLRIGSAREPAGATR